MIWKFWLMILYLELASQSTEFKNISVIGHYEDIEPIIKELARL